MKALKLLLTFILFAFAFEGFAQDKIYLKGSKDVIAADIIEIGNESVRYKPYNNPESPILNIDKQLILKVVTKNGDTFTFADRFTDTAYYVGQRKNALKIGFLNPFVGSTQFSFEHSMKPGRSIEFTLGIIGAGVDVQDDNAFGATFKFGYKFIKTPDFLMPGMSYSHLLKGGYIRPEVIMNIYNYTSYTYDMFGFARSTRETSISGAFVLNLGKQWIFDNVFLIDFYVGVGYGFASRSGGDNYGGFFYGFTGAEPQLPIALTGNLRIGFLLK
jgi:hypothetical protein